MSLNEIKRFKQIDASDTAIRAARFNKDKPELMYLLTFPYAKEELSKVCTQGGEKYDMGNYLKGAPLSQYTNSGLRHLFKWWNGVSVDKESGNLHLAHFVWNALMLLEMSQKEYLDDRFNQETVQNEN